MASPATHLSGKPRPDSLYPPGVPGPAAPLPVWRFLPTFLNNPLRTLPAGVYHEPILAPPGLKGRMAWVMAPQLVEQILLEEHETFPKSPIEQRIFASVLGDGILTAEGQSWRWQRRIVAPLFRHQEIVALVPDMSRVAEKWVRTYGNTPSGSVRAIDQDMTDATFDVLAATLFAGATEVEQSALKEHIGAYLGHTSWDVAFELLQIPTWVWHPAKPFMRRHARALQATVSRVLERERAKGFPGGGLMAKLGMARDPQSGEPMSDALVRSNLLTFAAAGHETTAKALTWSLYLLARAADWQDRVAAEVRSLAGDGPIAADHLDRLDVTRRVLKEAMRLYPPAPVMGRMAASAVTVGGHRFEAGTVMVIPVWAIHRHHSLWEDPERFDPDRFLAEREAHMHRAQFIPFGFGPRTCIGMGFAMLEALVLLASLVRHVRFEWDGRHRPEPVSRVTLRARGGMPLRIAPR
ncbi:MAG: cytochrome P450 [Hyphomicrobiaceae bacterium]